MSRLALRFGATAPPIMEQLEEQGFRLPAIELLGFQADTHAVSRLYIRGILTKREADAAHRRLFKRIERVLKQEGGAS